MSYPPNSPAARCRAHKRLGGKVAAVLSLALFGLLLVACGGGGGGGSASAPPNVETPTPPSNPPDNTQPPTNPAPTNPQPAPAVYRVAYAYELGAGNSAAALITAAVPDDYRYLTRNGVSVTDGAFAPVTVITPGGLSGLSSNSQTFGEALITLDNTWPASLRGVAARERVYVADFPNHNCAGGITFAGLLGQVGASRRYLVHCKDTAQRSINTVTVFKTQTQIYQVCWRDSRRAMNCDLRYNNNASAFVGLAFPKQTYRRDDGKCESAPFYAVDKCQRENAVDIGDFSAFVSGLNGDGYRQFGIRHRLEWDDWNVAGMVSHARGDVFADTWWTRLRADRRVWREVKGFAEYESGVTSLRQNGRVFDDLPISGGRVGFAAEDFTMSFGRPMHHKGKGKNSAALHWQVNRDSNFGLMHTGGDIRARIEWRAKF